MKAYFRAAEDPRWSQDEATYLLVGKFCHAFNARYKVWFVTAPAPATEEALNRPRTKIHRVTLFSWLRLGRRAWVAVLEELLGRRFDYMARRMVRWPLGERWRAKMRLLAQRDALQSWGEYDTHREPIRVGFG